MGSILSFLGGLVGKLLASLFGSKESTAQDLAASNAAAQVHLNQQEQANATTLKVVGAAAAADARSLRENPGAASNAIVSGPGVGTVENPDLPYRD